MADAKTELANQALLHLGKERLNSITENTPSGALCRDVIDTVIKEVYELRDFKCTKTRKTIVVDAASPEFGYSFRYLLPSGCLTPLEVWQDGIEITDWIREGSYILTDAESEIDLIYVSNIDLSALPASIGKVIWLTMCIRIAPTINVSSDRLQLLGIELKDATNDALAIDGRQKYRKKGDTSFIDCWKPQTTDTRYIKTEDL
jgi:hypothetical protein